MLTIVIMLAVTSLIAALITRYSHLMAAGVSAAVFFFTAISAACFLGLFVVALFQGVLSSLLFNYFLALAVLSVLNVVQFLHSWKKLTQ